MGANIGGRGNYSWGDIELILIVIPLWLILKLFLLRSQLSFYYLYCSAFVVVVINCTIIYEYRFYNNTICFYFSHIGISGLWWLPPRRSSTVFLSRDMVRNVKAEYEEQLHEATLSLSLLHKVEVSVFHFQIFHLSNKRSFPI